MIAKLIKEPLVHFFFFGALIFGWYALVGDEGFGDDREIIITAGQIDRMIAAYQKTRMRPPTDDELRGLIENFVQEEIYYREAVAMGLDDNNPIVRRAMRRKMEFVANASGTSEQPSDAELTSFLETNQEVFLTDGTLSFRHIYFSTDKRGQSARTDASSALEDLRAGRTVNGDLFLLDSEYRDTADSEIERLFGELFIEQLIEAEVGSWQGPYESGYGLHLVFVENRVAPALPELESIRTKVENEWRGQQQAAAADDFYQELRNSYTVTIEEIPAL